MSEFGTNYDMGYHNGKRDGAAQERQEIIEMLRWYLEEKGFRIDGCDAIDLIKQRSQGEK